LTGGGQIILGLFEDGTQGNTEASLRESYQNSYAVTLTNFDNTIRGFGRIGEPDFDRWLILNNTSLITADVPDKILRIELRQADNTGGTFRAANGAHLQLWSRLGFDNVDGRLEARDTSKFSFVGATTITGGTLLNDGALPTATKLRSRQRDSREPLCSPRPVCGGKREANPVHRDHSE
jgi:hypothetical protein